MVDYVVKVTKDATQVSPLDHERLRQNGFDDKAILQITLIAAWFNYINRVADALGIDPEPEMCEAFKRWGKDKAAELPRSKKEIRK